MLNQDKEYILWLCQRLVNKYKENPKIIDNVINILNKESTQLDFYKKTHDIIDKNLNKAIKYIKQIQEAYQQSQKLENKFFVETQYNIINNTFEEINMDSLLK